MSCCLSVIEWTDEYGEEWTTECGCPECECPCDDCAECEDCDDLGVRQSRSARRRSFTKAEKEAMFAKQKGQCMYCGKREREYTYFDADHKTPFSLGGPTSLSNGQMLCRPCNTRKGDLTNREFRTRYKLIPASKAKGPPEEEILQEYFEKISKTIAKKKATKRRTQRRSAGQGVACCRSISVWENEVGEEWEIECTCPECECPCDDCAECVECY